MINEVKKMRLFFGYTQQEVADIIGISREHFNRIEKGKNVPSVELALSIEYVLRTRIYSKPFMLSREQTDLLDKRIQKIVKAHED